jgi:tRNA1Val (adenine37-N6)-methyltransferase
MRKKSARQKPFSQLMSALEDEWPCSAQRTRSTTGGGGGGAPVIADETLDTFFNGRLKLYQGRRGYRSTLDTLLLAFFASIREGDRVIDLGTGNGALALILADLYPAVSVVGLEVQSTMLGRAAHNITINGHDKRVSVLRGDVRAIADAALPESFDVVVSNPPYRSVHAGRVSPYPEKTAARHETNGTLADFVRAAAYLLPTKGRFAVVYHAARLVDLVQAMRQAQLEPKRLRMVHSMADCAASLLLMEAVKGGRCEMRVLPPLAIFNHDRSYTGELKAMLEGKRYVNSLD